MIGDGRTLAADAALRVEGCDDLPADEMRATGERELDGGEPSVLSARDGEYVERAPCERDHRRVPAEVQHHARPLGPAVRREPALQALGVHRRLPAHGESAHDEAVAAQPRGSVRSDEVGAFGSRQRRGLHGPARAENGRAHGSGYEQRQQCRTHPRECRAGNLNRGLTRRARTYDRRVAALPRNPEIADQFELLADLLELEGAESFRVIAYRRAATRMRDTSGSVAQLALDGKAKELQGIGKTIEEKIVQIVEHGEIEALAKRKASIPPEVVLFMRLPGLGPKTAARIWKELGISTLAELKAAAEGERLRSLAGLGARSEEKILQALAFQAENPDEGRRLLGEGLPAVQAVVSVLAQHPSAVAVSEAGSVRRRKETFRDLDIIATATDPAELTSYFTQLPWVVDVVAHGDTKATVVSNEGLRFDLRVVPPESFGNLLQHFTGSKEHNVAMREDAVRRGLSISEYGVTAVETGDVFSSEDEDEVYAFLGYQPIPPELRENAGELEAARRGELPKLVELADLRGDLHTHTHWSADGKSTLEQMVAAAAARGYDYYAITDHSHYLREGRLAAQLEEIERVRARFPKLRILAGVEANIRANGEVDLSQEELSRLDWVVASVHNAPENRPTERVLEAMDNPYVDCIGHLTGRRIRKRAPRDVDVERVVEKALEVGCFLEINGQPDRLDLRDVHARAAKEAGLKLAVNSDAHRIEAQDYVELGIGQARRGWLTKEDVLNTRTWKQIEKLQRKRP